MNTSKIRTQPAFAEFVALVSMMMALTALSIDAMLPALPHIANDLHVQNPNDRQLVVSVMFLGLAIGQLFFGPLSDSTGRKPALYAGFAPYSPARCWPWCPRPSPSCWRAGCCRGSASPRRGPSPWPWYGISTPAGPWHGSCPL